MKLCKVIKGGLKSIERLEQAVREKIYDGSSPALEGRRATGGGGGGDGWSQPSSAFMITLAPPGSLYEPPQGKEGLAGAQRSFPKQGIKPVTGGGGGGEGGDRGKGGGMVVGSYWPMMPCLSCGCPWWAGEDWDGVCVRCGWDCEADGYDDDSRPLPGYRARFEAFSAAIKQGRVAEHHE